MATEPSVDPQINADEEAVMESCLTGKPLDPEVARRVNERARQITEETFRKHGLVDIAVPAIRELRGELPT
jgi:hypothetical protein